MSKKLVFVILLIVVGIVGVLFLYWDIFVLRFQEATMIHDDNGSGMAISEEGRSKELFGSVKDVIRGGDVTTGGQEEESAKNLFGELH